MVDAFGVGQIQADTVPDQLTYPVVSQAVVERALPHIVVPQLFTRLPTGGRQSVTIPVEGGSKTAVASRIGPGDQIPLDIAPIDSQTLTTYKIGRGHPIEREIIMFQQFPLAQQRLRRLGFVMGNTVNSDAMSVLNDGRESANDQQAGGAGDEGNKTLGTNGTEFQRENSIGQYGIIGAKKEVMEENLDPDVLLLNPQGYEDVSRLPQYSAQLLYGEPAFQTGERGFVEGLRILVSSIVNANFGYTIASGVTNTSLGQYVPMGYMAESLPITTTVREAVDRDSYEVYSVAMYVPATVLGEAIAAIDYS